MKVQFAQIPSCGAPPNYEMITANFDDTLYQFDWNLLNRMNLEYVKATQDPEDLEKLIYSFTDSHYGAVERQFLPFPLSKKLYEMLQLGFDYLLRKQTKLQKELKVKNEEIKYLRHKLEKSLETIPKFVGTDVKVVHTCPVCNKAYKSFYHLDKHMNKAHTYMCDAWNALRNKQPYGASLEFRELQTEIDHLRGYVTKQNLEENSIHPITQREKMSGKQPPKKSNQKGDQKIDPGHISESICVQPRRYKCDFIDSHYVDIPPKLDT